MANDNPFSGAPVLAAAWEQGYLAGFAEPETDHTPPLAPDGLEAYAKGEQAGRDDRRRLPPDGGGESSDTAEHLGEIAVELGLHALEHKLFEDLFGLVGGLIPLVRTAMQIPTDTPIRPLEDDWEGPAELPSEDLSQDSFVAVCSRTDHGPLDGTTSDGYWAGPVRSFFFEAVADVKKHGHPEGGVARCSVTEGRCGLVWPGPIP